MSDLLSFIVRISNYLACETFYAGAIVGFFLGFIVARPCWEYMMTVRGERREDEKEKQRGQKALEAAKAEEKRIEKLKKQFDFSDNPYYAVGVDDKLEYCLFCAEKGVKSPFSQHRQTGKKTCVRCGKSIPGKPQKIKKTPKSPKNIPF